MVLRVGTQDVTDVLTFVWAILFDIQTQADKQHRLSGSSATGPGKEYRVLEPPYSGRLYYKGFSHWEGWWRPDYKTILPTRRGPPPRPRSIKDITTILDWRIREIPKSPALGPALNDPEQHRTHQDAGYPEPSSDVQTYGFTLRAIVYAASETTDTTSSEVSRVPSAVPSLAASGALRHNPTRHDYENDPHAHPSAGDQEVYDRSARLTPAYDETTPLQGEAYPGHAHSEEHGRWYGGGRKYEYNSDRGGEEDCESSSSEEIIGRDAPVYVPRGQRGNINIPGRDLYGRGAVNVADGDVGGGIG